MADTIFQKRIYELVQYVQLPIDDPNYINPAGLFLAIDKEGFDEPLKFSLIDILSSAHIENDIGTPTSTSFSVTYDSEFGTSSYYLQVKVYKQKTFGSDTIIQTHPYKNFTRSTTGFSLELEDFTGETIYIEYMAFEATLITSVEGLQGALDGKVNIDGDVTQTGVKRFNDGITIGGSATLSSVTTGNTDNDKIPTQGYVDDIGIKVLARGEITETGTVTLTKGITMTCVRNRTGTYTVTHNIGNTNYMVIANADGDAVLASNASIGTKAIYKQNNSFTINFSDDSSLNNTDFSFIIVKFMSVFSN